MLETKKSITLTGFAYANDSTGTKQPVAYLSASVSETDTPTISKTIQNRELYLANKSAVDSDMAEFENQAFSLIN